jgi:hypothetical protein
LQKEKLDIYVGQESWPDEYEAIEEAFGESFEVTITPSIHRFSEGELPLLISFAIGAVASGIFYDLIKKAILKLLDLQGTKITRRTVIRIRKEEREAIITKDSYFISSVKEDKEYESLDGLIDDLKDQQKP